MVEWTKRSKAKYATSNPRTVKQPTVNAAFFICLLFNKLGCDEDHSRGEVQNG